MIAVADRLHKGGAFQKSITSPEQAFTIVLAGYEMGMQPVEALNSFYSVNGKLTIFGVAMSKRLRIHGWRITVGKHDKEVCEVTISKGDEQYSYTATKEEVIALGSQAYSKAPKDKLYWHALSRLIRQSVPEVLGSATMIHEDIEGNTAFTEAVVVEEDTEEEEEKALQSWLVVVADLHSFENYEKVKPDLTKALTLLKGQRRETLYSAIADKIDEIKDITFHPETQSTEPVNPKK